VGMLKRKDLLTTLMGLACLVVLHNPEALANAFTELELTSQSTASGTASTPPESLAKNSSSSGFQMGTLGTSASGTWTFDESDLVAGTFPQSAGNSVSASVNFGELKVYSSSEASRTGSFSVVDSGGTVFTLPNPYQLSSGGEAAVFWVDTITATGLPLGTPVEIGLAESLYSTSGHIGDCDDAAVDDEEALNFTSVSATGALFLQQGPCDYFHPSAGTVIGTGNSVSTTITLPVGEILNLEQVLLVDTGVIVGEGADETSAVFDALDTGLFALDILTPGASYVSDSGTIYLTELPTENIPEPSSAWLLAAGLGVVWLRCSALSCQQRRHLTIIVEKPHGPKTAARMPLGS
jgi:hypothetical protein